jgi:hypothetical protein
MKMTQRNLTIFFAGTTQQPRAPLLRCQRLAAAVAATTSAGAIIRLHFGFA